MLAALVVVVLTGCALLVALAWAYRYGPPHLAVHERSNCISIAPVFLGEYYLGIDEVEVRDDTGLRVLAKARRGSGRSPSNVELCAGVDALGSLREAGWEVTVAPSDGALIPVGGRSYRVRLLGNNGSGHATWAACTVRFPTEQGADASLRR